MKRRFSPTKYTMAFLRNKGAAVRVVERWIPVVNIRKDLFGFDIIALLGTDAIGIQCGISAHAADKVRKAVADPDVKLWLNTRNKFLVWTWGKRVALKKDGTRKLRDEYKAKITELKLVDGVVTASDFALL